MDAGGTEPELGAVVGGVAGGEFGPEPFAGGEFEPGLTGWFGTGDIGAETLNF